MSAGAYDLTQPLELHKLTQGSPEWLSFRKTKRPASLAAVVMGESPHMTRNELLDAYASGLWPEATPIQQQIFDEGHRVEALYRPRAEEYLASALYPIVGSRGLLSASADGFFEDENGNWECKSLNEALRAALPARGWDGCERNQARHLPLFYRIQMEQQCQVFRIGRVLFTAAEYAADGTLLDERLCWYESDPDLAAEIIASWKQFDADLLTHKPIPRVEKVRAEAVEQLPALSSSVAGTLVVTHNFIEFGEKLRAYIATLPREPKTDQDFANLADAVKRLDAAEKALDAEENRALASLAPVNKMRTEKATLQEYARKNRLAFNTLVETQKKLLRSQILMEAQAKFDEFVFDWNAKLKRPILSTATGTIKDAGIADAMSGKKSIQGWRDGANQAVADACKAVTKVGELVEKNLAAYAELVLTDTHRALFHDLNTQLLKDPEAFRIIVGARISDWTAKEEKRLEAERAKIREEEQALADERARKRLADEQAAAAPAPTAAPAATTLHGDQVYHPGGPGGMGYERGASSDRGGWLARGAPVAPGATVRVEGLRHEPDLRLTPETLPAPVVTDAEPTMTITSLNTRLKFTVTAAFLEGIGIKPAATDGNAKRYHEADLPRICVAIRNHLLGVSAQTTLANVSA